MKRTIITGLSLFVCSLLFAQVQKGIVRTAERPGKSSRVISSVTIRPAGEYNPSVSDDSGEFSLFFRGFSDGDGFKLRSVRKNGYEVASDVLSRTYAYSSKVPLEIVMYNSAELQQEKQELAERYADKMMADVRKEKAQLEEQLRLAKINEQEYQQKLNELYDRSDNFQALIDRLSDIYVRTDYARLDTLDRKINLLIEQGEFEKADSLIRSKGDPDERMREYREQERAQFEAEQQLRVQAEKIGKSRENIDKSREGMLTDFFNLYTTAMSRLDIDEAEHMMRQLISLNPEDAQYYSDLAALLGNFRSDFAGSISVLQGGIDLIKQRFGENAADLSILYNRMGDMLDEMDRYDEALDYYRKAERLVLDNPDVFGAKSLATVYHNMSATYLHLGQLSKAEGFISKALNLYAQSSTVTESEKANALGSYSLILQNKGQYVKSLDYALESLALRDALPEGVDKQISLAASYARLANLYHDTGNLDEAIEYGKKALDIRKSVYGDIHSTVADQYNELGNLYLTKGDSGTGRNYLDQALEIYVKLYGDNSTRVGYVLNNIANILKGAGMYNEARDLYLKSYEIAENKTGNESFYAVTNLLNLSSAERALHHFQPALDYANRAWDIIGRLYEDQIANYVVPCLVALGSIYEDLAQLGYDNHKTALDYYLQAYEKQINIPNANPLVLAAIYDDLAEVYAHLNDFDNALSYAYQALALYNSTVGEDSNSVSVCYSDLGNVYSLMGRFDDALDAYSKSLAIDEKRFPDNHVYFVNDYTNVSRVYAQTGELEKELAYLRKAEAVMANNPSAKAIYSTQVYYRMGVVLQQLGDIDGALASYQKALENPSEYSDVFIQSSQLDLGLIYFTLGQLDESESLFRNALPLSADLFERAPNDNAVNYWTNLNNLGYLLFVEGKYKESDKYLHDAYNLIKPRFDSDPGANITSLGNTLVNMCFLYMTTGDMNQLSNIAPEANEISKILYEFDAESFTSYYVTTLKCMYLTDPNNADQWLKMLGEVDPQDPDYLQLSSPQ